MFDINEEGKESVGGPGRVPAIGLFAGDLGSKSVRIQVSEEVEVGATLWALAEEDLFDLFIGQVGAESIDGEEGLEREIVDGFLVELEVDDVTTCSFADGLG